MGCDGGTIPTREELVNVKKKDVRLDPKLNLDAVWKYCALSTASLKEPIVACELGRMYNKEAVLQFLLSRDEASPAQIETMEHIRGLKDLTELSLTPSASRDGTDIAAKFACPVSGVEMNGVFRFVFLRKCGCVLSERALREVPSATCHKCDKPFVLDDVIVLNGNKEEVAELHQRMLERRAKAKAAKKAKKAAAAAATAAESASASASAATSSSSASSSAPAASKSASAEPSAGSKRKASQDAKPVIKLPRSAAPGLEQTVRSALSHKTVKDNPQASATYKSLFTSSAKKDPAKDGNSYTSRIGYATYH